MQYLLNRLYSLPQQTPTIELLHTLIQEIIQEEEYTYQTYFQFLTSNQIQLLKAIAKEEIVNEINSASADVIFSILPSPLQEQFLTENKSKLDAKIWYGLSSDYAPRSRISRISQIAGRLIHKKKLQSKLHKYNKD